ncbi:MAG: hypothetical protein GXP49_07620 [Deltaproteobacteria bacterium]|nr:hypothetical protein [Deltaproteobacteria bacterium]
MKAAFADSRTLGHDFTKQEKGDCISTCGIAMSAVVFFLPGLHIRVPCPAE